MYCVGRCVLHQHRAPELYRHLAHLGVLANNLSNAAMFRIRQNFTMHGKAFLSENEEAIAREISLTEARSGKKAPGALMSYPFLERLMRATDNPDFFAGLPMQCAQWVLKERVRDMKGWLAALREYRRDPSAFTGKPKMPGYGKKGSMRHMTFTNQECVIRRSGKGCFLKFPLTRETFRIQALPETARLKEVKVRPYYSDLEILYTYECEVPVSEADLCHSAAIDFGVNNAAAIVTNEGHALLVKGGAVKAANQWSNKRRAECVRLLTKGKPTKTAPQSRMLNSLSQNRQQFLTDAYHQISSRIVRFCFDHRIGTLVLGKSTGWKQRAGIGRKNNQSFVSLPIDRLRFMISYKAERAGIRVIGQEESYTSRASFLDKDDIPVYGKDDRNAVFSGTRRYRGSYVSKDGIRLNADINAAANILRKAEQTAFEGVSNFDYLQEPQVLRYTDLHKSNPARIAAV